MGDDRKHRKAKGTDHASEHDDDHEAEDQEHDRDSGRGHGRERDSDREEFKPSGLIGEAAKKIFTAGVTAAFMTEESIRGYLSEVKLPKELLTLIIQGASKSKDELTSRVGKEVIGMIQKIDFVKEASRFAETHKFKITAEIEIQKKEDKSQDAGDAKTPPCAYGLRASSARRSVGFEKVSCRAQGRFEFCFPSASLSSLSL